MYCKECRIWRSVQLYHALRLVDSVLYQEDLTDYSDIEYFTFNTQAICYLFQGKFERAEGSYLSMLELPYLTKDQEVNIYVNLGAVYDYQKKFPESFKLLLDADKMIEEGYGSDRDNFVIQGSFARFYYNMGDLENAISQYYAELELAQILEYTDELPIIYNNLSIAYIDNDSLEKGLSLANQASSLVDINHREGGVSLLRKAEYNLKRKKFEIADSLNKLAIQSLEISKYHYFILHALNQKLRIKSKQENFDELGPIIEDAFSKYSTYMSKQDSLIFEEMRLRMILKNNYSDDLYDQLNYVLSSNNIEEINKLKLQINTNHVKYESEKKDLKNHLLLTSNKAKSARIKFQHYLIGFCCVGFILLSGLVLLYRKQKSIEFDNYKIQKRENQLLEEENQRLLESNQGLSQRITDQNLNVENILGETWIINPSGRRSQETKIGDILAICTPLDKANTLEYILKNSKLRPQERRTIKNLANDPNLAKEIFVQISQSYIVNLYNIASIEESKKLVNLKYSETQLSASDRYIKNLMTKFRKINPIDIEEIRAIDNTG